MREIVDDGSAQIADARGAGRFTGEEAGAARRHAFGPHRPAPAACRQPASSANGRFKDVVPLKTMISDAGIDLSKPVVRAAARA